MSALAAVLDERLAAWRRDTPGCQGRIHLNNAGASFSPLTVVETELAHFRREQEIGGYEAADEAAGRLCESYENLGRLLGCAARNVAVVENATVAFSLALSAFDFEQGDRLVTTHNDYTSNQIMYQALARRRRIEVLFAEDLPEGGVDPGSVRRLAAHPRCRLVALTWIPTNSGLVQDAEAVGEVCETAGVPYLVDACQAVGQIPVDPARLRCDYLGGTARKFLRGPRGLGFLYVSDRALARGDYPLGLDMRGAEPRGEDGFELADGARRFENWEFPYALVLGLGEAARYALAVGVELAGELAGELATHARERLSALPGVSVRDRGRRLCAIATAEVAGLDATEIVHRLRDQNINTSVAASEDGSPVPVVRVSPHYYNTREEVDTLVDAIEALIQEERR
ncbi:MAG: aminotransferase class V-fold PLP-dependent enzyme [Thermoanaerobaculia bacterium]